MNLLGDINDKFEKIPESKRQQLEDAYEPCVEVLQDLDKLVNHYNGLDTKSKRAWDRLKWDPDKSRTLRDRLTSSVSMLNAFYTSLIHDNQVLILEALERLEQDYRGGHREESIASLERITSGAAEDVEGDEEAWTQILRDLEDVGVAKHAALSYRDVIVNWLVQAVNDGRLLEQREEPDSFASLQDDLATALPTTYAGDQPGTHYLDVPEFTPFFGRSQSAPSWPPSPMLSPAQPQDQRTQSIPSSVSLDPRHSGLSSYPASQSSDTDTSSLYASPEPAPRRSSVQHPSTTQIRRVPVPTRDTDPQNLPVAHHSPATATTPPPGSSEKLIVSQRELAASWATPIPEPMPVLTTYHSTPARPPPPVPQVNPLPPALTFPPVTEAPQPSPVPTRTPSSSVSHSPSASAFFPDDPILVTASNSHAPFSHPAFLAPQAPQAPPAVHYNQSTSAPPLLQTPPSYYDKDSSITADLAWTAQQIVAAWSRKDFATAAKHLEEQLTAVERGQTVLYTGAQPDRRILRHLLGVCNSFTGNFTKAKSYFESVFNGIYLNRANLDDGDIAAARWLGDVCLHLREHHNAALAWGVAHEGSIGRYGVVRDRTRRVAEELRVLDHWLLVFRRVENSFLNNIDPTDIFKQTHAVEKSNLILSLRTHLYEMGGYQQSRIPPPTNPFLSPSYLIGPRPKLDINISEGFLLGPLISLNAWPLPWDPSFSPADAVRLDRYMNSVRTANVIVPLADRVLPAHSLGASTKLHYATKRGNKWLVETVKKALNDMCIEHAEHTSEAAIMCTINQHREGFAFSEGVKICFKKLQFRSVCGLQVTEVLYSTRILSAGQSKDTTDFRDMLKGILDAAERDASNVQSGGIAPSLVYESYR